MALLTAAQIRAFGKEWLAPRVFNYSLLALSFFFGRRLELEDIHIVLILFIFHNAREDIGSAKHFKGKMRCFVNTSASWFSLMAVGAIGFLPALIMAVVFAYAVTEKSDHVPNASMHAWKDKSAPSKHQRLIDKCQEEYQKSRPCQELLDFEEYLKRLDALEKKRKKPERFHKIFRLRFVTKTPYSEIAELLGTDTGTVSRTCDSIYIDFVERNIMLSP